MSTLRFCIEFAQVIINGLHISQKIKTIVLIKKKRKKKHLKPVATPRLHRQKFLFCLWRNMNTDVHWNLLLHGITIIVDFCWQHLYRENSAIRRKSPVLVNRKGVIVQYDIAEVHSVKQTKEKYWKTEKMEGMDFTKNEIKFGKKRKNDVKESK